MNDLLNQNTFKISKYTIQIILIILISIMLTIYVWLVFNKKIEDIDNSEHVEYINTTP